MKILYINSPKYDLITALHIEGFNKLNIHDIYYTSLGNYAPKSRVLDEKDAENFGKNKADLIILGSRPYVNEILFTRLLNTKAVKVVIEGGDESYINYPLLRFRKIDFLFKREIYKESEGIQSFMNSIFPKRFGLWTAIRTHKFLKYPYFHSMSNVANIKKLKFLRVFLKNILLTFLYKNKIHSFSLGIEDRFIGEFNNAPQYSFSCMLRAHNDERKELLAILKSLNVNNSFYELISPSQKAIEIMTKKGSCHPHYIHEGGIGMAQNEDYLNQISNSLACISIPGGGFDTLRFWEILARGSLLVSKRIDIEIYNSLEEGVHYLAFDTKKELEELMQFVLQNPEKVNKIRKNGYKFALKNHTSVSRAEYFLQKVRRD